MYFLKKHISFDINMVKINNYFQNLCLGEKLEKRKAKTTKVGEKF